MFHFINPPPKLANQKLPYKSFITSKLPEKVRSAIEDKLQAEQEAQRMEFVLLRENQEAERKRVEAKGIADANTVISGSLSENYLRWYWVTNLDKHQDVIYVPTGNDGMPMFKSVS